MSSLTESPRSDSGLFAMQAYPVRLLPLGSVSPRAAMCPKRKVESDGGGQAVAGSVGQYLGATTRSRTQTCHREKAYEGTRDIHVLIHGSAMTHMAFRLQNGSRAFGGSHALAPNVAWADSATAAGRATLPPARVMPAATHHHLRHPSSGCRVKSLGRTRSALSKDRMDPSAPSNSTCALRVATLGGSILNPDEQHHAGRLRRGSRRRENRGELRHRILRDVEHEGR